MTKDWKKKSGQDPNRMTRAVFDRYCDQTTRRMERYRARQLEQDRKIRLIEEFLNQGPHGVAWKLFQAQQPRE